jgi:type IV pilus assembly protein PilC
MPEPIDYRTPSNEPERGGGFHFSLGMALPVALFVGVLCIILLFVIPRLENVFKDFGTNLPLPTMFVLGVSRWFRSAYMMWGLALCLPIAAGLFAPQSKSARRWMRLLIMLCFAGVVILMALAVLMPMMTMVETISNPKR